MRYRLRLRPGLSYRETRPSNVEDPNRFLFENSIGGKKKKKKKKDSIRFDLIDKYGDNDRLRN